MSPAIGRVLLEPQKNSRHAAGAALEDQEARAVHALGVAFLTASRDVLELVRRCIVVGDGRLLTHIKGLGAAGQGQNVDLSSEVDNLLIALGNAVVAGGIKPSSIAVPLVNNCSRPRKPALRDISENCSSEPS